MTEHYFTTPTGPEKRREIEATIWDRDYTFTTATGTFSYDGLDLGTRVLLRSCQPRPGSTRLLDLGCGWGPIAIALATELPHAHVDAVDVNERALALTQHNAQVAGVAAQVHASTPDQLARATPTDPTEGYHEIWSNPPIRIGKDALHELLLRWLPHLHIDGRALLVVSRNLGADSLQRWIIDHGWPTERIASAKGFRVLEVRKQRP